MVMNDWLPLTLSGAFLVVLGVLMIRSHRRTWQRHRDDSSLAQRELQYFFAQYRRRLQTSAIIALLGVLLFVGDVVLPRILYEEDFMEVFPFFWIVVLCLTLWIFILAWGDVTAIRIHSKTVLNCHLKEQRKLEEELAKLKNRQSNGEASSS
jgi:drug/metabolite transporter (DMT)-like permease